MLSELVVPAAAWWWAAAARLLAALHALNELAWGRGDNPDTLIFSSLSTQANKQLATNITRPKRFGIHHVVRARCYNVIMLSKGAWFRAFLGNPPKSATLLPGVYVFKAVVEGEGSASGSFHQAKATWHQHLQGNNHNFGGIYNNYAEFDLCVNFAKIIIISTSAGFSQSFPFGVDEHTELLLPPVALID